MNKIKVLEKQMLKFVNIFSKVGQNDENVNETVQDE